MNALLELAERCERAARPERQLDCDIAVAALGFFTMPPRYEGLDVRYCYVDGSGVTQSPGQAGDMLVPELTASIDAAMKLVPDGVVIRLAFGSARLSDAQVDWKHPGLGATPALALCAAALRARAASVVGELAQ